MATKLATGKEEHLLAAFARMVGSKVINGRVAVPAKYGSGYVLGMLFGSQLRLIVRHYNLKEELVIQRQMNVVPPNMIQFSFKHILKEKEDTSAKILPAVTITTQGLEPEFVIPGNTSFNAINLAIDAAYLKQLLQVDIEGSILHDIVNNNQPLVFDQLLTAELQEIGNELVAKNVSAPLHHFFFRIKAEALICYLLMELVQREGSSLQSINTSDMKALYMIRDVLISDLSKAPSLNELSVLGGMSESKLKRLFKQVFGCGVHEYYQAVRMKEAAHLLRSEKLSVSEVGYQLGFSNLSHFTRVFEAHLGMKPKKYTKV